MADKSPRQHMQKKAGSKSIKEKRLEKKAKASGGDHRDHPLHQEALRLRRPTLRSSSMAARRASLRPDVRDTGGRERHTHAVSQTPEEP